MSETKIALIVVTTLIIILSIACGAYYLNHKLSIDNFQNTIKDLSDEQKCLHICGFQYSGMYLENYKFCAEKCDRISERQNINCLVK